MQHNKASAVYRNEEHVVVVNSRRNLIEDAKLGVYLASRSLTFGATNDLEAAVEVTTS